MTAETRPPCTLPHPRLQLHVDAPDRLHRLLHDHDALITRTDRFRAAVESFVASYPATEDATYPGAAVIAQLREIMKEFG